MVSNIDWPASYVGTELLFSCNITPAGISVIKLMQIICTGLCFQSTSQGHVSLMDLLPYGSLQLWMCLMSVELAYLQVHFYTTCILMYLNYIAGASCNREEIRNMQWPEIPIGSEVTRYCIQNRSELQ